MLGGYRDKIPAYASTATFASVEEYLDVATQCLDLGYQAFKVHAWGDVRKDAELAARLRAHVGDDLPLMYDGSAGFDLPDAIYLGRALADAGFLWYEEPMREFSVTAYGHLARAVGIPLLVAETSDGVHMNTADFIAAGAATFGVRVGTQMRGGITGCMRTAHLADAFRLRAEVHGPEITSRHLCMAVPNTTYFESLVTSTTGDQEAGGGPRRPRPRPGRARHRPARRAWTTRLPCAPTSRTPPSPRQPGVRPAYELPTSKSVRISPERC